MIGLLILVGLGWGVSTLLSDEEDGALQFKDDETDFIVAEELRADVTAELTPERLALVDFVAGPINVNTGAGPDAVFGGSFDDTVAAGSGDDLVFGGAGDDTLDLGSGNDVSGLDPETTPAGIESVSFELGDDTVSGGDGNDEIYDPYGSNTLSGGRGNDTIDAVDRELSGAVTADVIFAGRGDDIIDVDQGDRVTTGEGSDTVTVDVWDYNETGTPLETVTITDYEPGSDQIFLKGSTFDLRPSGGSIPVTVEDLPDGTGATISINGSPVVLVIGGQGMTAGDVTITT